MNIYFDMEQIVDYQQVNNWIIRGSKYRNKSGFLKSVSFYFFLGNIGLKWKELNMDERMLQTDFSTIIALQDGNKQRK